MAAPSAVRLGELRVRQGRLDEARALFEEGRAAPPARWSRSASWTSPGGDAEAATEAAERVLRRTRDDNLLERLPALELAARARAAAGDHAARSSAATEVERSSARLGTPYLRAAGCAVRAEVSLARDATSSEARRAAEDAMDLFATASAPFERPRHSSCWPRPCGASARRARG